MDQHPTDTVAAPPVVHPDGPCLDLELAAERESLRTVRMVAMAFLRAQYDDQFPQLWLEELMLALQEACTNVVRHAYQEHTSGKPLHVQLQACPRLIRFQICDAGPGFDFTDSVPPDFQKPKDGGYGLHLLRKIMTRVEYRRDSPRNVLILEKLLPDPVVGAAP